MRTPLLVCETFSLVVNFDSYSCIKDWASIQLTCVCTFLCFMEAIFLTLSHYVSLLLKASRQQTRRWKQWRSQRKMLITRLLTWNAWMINTFWVCSSGFLCLFCRRNYTLNLQLGVREEKIVFEQSFERL